MDPDKELSDLKMERVECSICGAVWINGQHRWRTGITGDEETLSNLVCSYVTKPGCINKKAQRGKLYTNKDSWEKRAKFIDAWSEEQDA